MLTPVNPSFTIKGGGGGGGSGGRGAGVKIIQVCFRDEDTYLRTSVPIEDSDQHADLRRLIRLFVE